MSILKKSLTGLVAGGALILPAVYGGSALAVSRPAATYYMTLKGYGYSNGYATEGPVQVKLHTAEPDSNVVTGELTWEGVPYPVTFDIEPIPHGYFGSGTIDFNGVDESLTVNLTSSLSEIAGTFTNVLDPSTGGAAAAVNFVAGADAPSLKTLRHAAPAGQATTTSVSAAGSSVPSAQTSATISGGGGSDPNVIGLSFGNSLVLEVEGNPIYTAGPPYYNQPTRFTARIWSDFSNTNYWVDGATVTNHFPGVNSFTGFQGMDVSSWKPNNTSTTVSYSIGLMYAYIELSMTEAVQTASTNNLGTSGTFTFGKMSETASDIEFQSDSVNNGLAITWYMNIMNGTPVNTSYTGHLEVTVDWGVWLGRSWGFTSNSSNTPYSIYVQS